MRFRGGAYRFHELAEYLEDAGGMIIQENRLHIIRGSSFIREELHVLMMWNTLNPWPRISKAR